MNARFRRGAVVLGLLVCTPLLRAQTDVGAAGHWEGVIKSPTGEIRVEIDIARNATGGLSGAFSQPDRRLKGLPLTRVALTGAALEIELPASGGRTMHAEIAADGRSMAGVIETQAGPVPFRLTRTGEARLEPTPRSAGITKELEGTWNGTLDVKGGLRVVLKMKNEADGTATGSMISVDEGALEIPVAIVQNGEALTLDMNMVGGSYKGTLNSAKAELVGVYTTGEGIEVPLTLRRAATR